MTKSTDKERYEIWWDPDTAEGNLMLHSESHVREQNLDHLYIKAIPEHAEERNEPNFFPQQIFDPGSAKRALPHRLREVGTTPKEEGWYQAASKETEDDRQFTFTLVSPMDKNLDRMYKDYTHLEPRRDAMCVVDREGAQKKNKFYQPPLTAA